MTYLSEDPTPLVGGLVLIAGGFLLALKITQQGKYAIRAGIAIGLAVLVMIIERVWVTDKERIEGVIYSLQQAVLHANADAVLAYMAPTAQLVQGNVALSEDATRALIRSSLDRAQLDFVRVSDLQISVGYQSRHGKAEFRVFARGNLHTHGLTVDGGTNVSTWSLGFVETQPGIWKVNRITPVSAPTGLLADEVGGFVPCVASILVLLGRGIARYCAIGWSLSAGYSRITSLCSLSS
jgi:hypothetical protein